MAAPRSKSYSPALGAFEGATKRGKDEAKKRASRTERSGPCARRLQHVRSSEPGVVRGRTRRCDAGTVGVGRVPRHDPRDNTDGVPAGGQDRPGSEAARPAGDRRGREEVERWRRPPAESGLLLLPAGRDIDLDQPGNAEEHRRRRQRLPVGHGLLGLLRLDRQRQQLVRRDHSVPDHAGDAVQRQRLPAERRRPGDRARPCGHHLLRADRVQSLQRHERRLRSALDERGLHLVARVRADQRPLDHGRRRARAARSAIRASPATAS